MSNFSAHKQRVSKPTVMSSLCHEMDRVPGQFCDYMKEVNCRFSEVCNIYLDGLSMDDVKYLKPEDLIALVPKEHYKHRLLMTIMVRRYLCRPDECESVCFRDSESESSSKRTCAKQKIEYTCNNCTHVCTISGCDHSCDDYIKIVCQTKKLD